MSQCLISVLGLGVLSATLGLAIQPAAADAETIELIQKRDVIQHHQRMVGNVRAQARREGVIRDVPQLFVFHGDASEAFHMHGHRSGFIREVNLTVQRQRRARSMVALDTLLERSRTPDGREIGLDALPAADVILLVYYRAECPECEQVQVILDEWLDENPQIEPLWIRISMDPVVTPRSRESAH